MDATAMIRAFAQGDMVYSFMRGIDSNLRQMIEGGISELMQKYADHLATLTGFAGAPLATFKATATATATSLSQGLRDEIEILSSQTYRPSSWGDRVASEGPIGGHGGNARFTYIF